MWCEQQGEVEVWGRDGFPEGTCTVITVMGDRPMVPREAGELETVGKSSRVPGGSAPHWSLFPYLGPCCSHRVS